MPLQLLVLRHGHAQQEPPPGGSDVDRPLRTRGRRALTALAPTVQALAPDLVLSSPSRRTRETVACLNLTAPIEYLEPLYAGDVDDLLDAVRDLAAREEPPATVLLVGHNPSVHQLVLELTGGEQLSGFPPATLAVLTLDVAGWDAADTGVAHLTAVHLPGDRQD